MSNLLEIDGAYGEGGGQILRSSLALSLLTGKGFHLHSIRANRDKPGLRPQHQMSVRAAAEVGNADVQGDSQGSRELTFTPGKVQPGNYRFDIRTAGATSLVLHTLALPLSYGTSGPSEVTIVGGTHVSTSPCFHFLSRTWQAYMAQLGLQMRLEMTRPGFYPRGGGEIRAILQPIDQLQGMNLSDRSELKITGFSAVAGLPDHIAKRQAERAQRKLKKLGHAVEIEQQQWDGGPGTVVGITLSSTPVPTTFYALGARGKSAEKVADEAVEQVERYLSSTGAVDWHSADQLLLPLAFATDSSEYSVSEVTQHLLTNVEVVRTFLDREIRCEGEEGQSGLVHIGPPE